MDFTTLIGILLGILSLVMGFVLEGGHLSSLIQGTAALIVFGGTAGAVVLGTPFRTLKKVPFILKYAFMNKRIHTEETIEKLINLANISRREGLLALERQLENTPENEFLAEGVQMIVDGAEATMIEDILNRSVGLYSAYSALAQNMYEAVDSITIGQAEVLANTGFRYPGGPAVQPRAIKIGKRTLTVRDAAGTPLWERGASD